MLTPKEAAQREFLVWQSLEVANVEHVPNIEIKYKLKVAIFNGAVKNPSSIPLSKKTIWYTSIYIFLIEMHKMIMHAATII